MTGISKEKAISEYKRLKTILRKQPSFQEFFKNTDITKRQIEKIFGSNSFSKLTKVAGDEPLLPFHKRPDQWTEDRVLQNWGNAVKKLGHEPTQAEWSHNELTPSIDWYRLKFGKWSDVPKIFKAYANNKPEWTDVLRLLTPEEAILLEGSSSVAKSNDYHGFIPPIIRGLEILGVKEGGSLEFEEKVNLAFQLLGFKVQRLGQGTGRNSDGIAIDRENNYAVFIDSKARRDGYSVGTDDRAFIEYTRTWEDDLKRQGLKHLYFVVVSSRFKGGVGRAAENLKKETGISALVMITSENLLKLIATKIQYSSAFSLKEFKDLLVQDGELENKKVDKWIQNLTKTDS